MLSEIFTELDRWVTEENAEAVAEGLAQIRPCTIRLLGQMALWEVSVPLTLAATRDVDVYADYDHAVQKQFEVLLAQVGKILDPHGGEIWMPEETSYLAVYRGRFVTGLVAEPDFVLLSKARMAPEKNRALLVEMLAKGPSQRFMALARKYEVDLEALV